MTDWDALVKRFDEWAARRSLWLTLPLAFGIVATLTIFFRTTLMMLVAIYVFRPMWEHHGRTPQGRKAMRFFFAAGMLMAAYADIIGIIELIKGAM